MLKLLEVGDISRLAEITPAAVRQRVASGELVPVAVTPRGVRLFSAEQVERFLERRRARAADRAAKAPAANSSRGT